MGECDYLNTRVRAMGAKLLPNELFEQLLSLDSDDLPMDALLASPFGPALREGLAHAEGIRAIEWALRHSIARSFFQVRRMAPPGAQALLDTQFARWDVQNVLAVVRGIETKASPRDIASALLPAGAFPEAQLTELAQSPDLISLARKLATWNYLFAFELHDSLMKRLASPFDLPTIERGLYRAYYIWALGLETSDRQNLRIVRSLLREQVDLANIKAALDIVKHPNARADPEGKNIASRFLPIPGGNLSDKFLARLVQSETLEQAFGVLDESYFAPGIEKGILAYGESRSLGVMERYLEEIVIRAGCHLYRLELLSISVPIGYLWRKFNETVNLRALCRGRSARIPANAIRKELLLV